MHYLCYVNISKGLFFQNKQDFLNNVFTETKLNKGRAQ